MIERNPKLRVQGGEMPGITMEEAIERTRLRAKRLPDEAPAQPQPTKPTPALRHAVKATDSAPSEVRAAHRTELPAAARPAEITALSTCDDNPVLNELGAAFVLGVSPNLLKKWWQRTQGPDYIQYGRGGPVRYEIKALLYFRDYYKTYLNTKRYPRRELNSNA
jgi:hypothetical protein